jgi:hypothetical protein
VIRLPGVTFIGRFLQHVLPPGFKRIRHYGLLSAARKRDRLAAARTALAVPPPVPVAVEAAADFLRRVTQKDLSRCPCCGRGTLQVMASRLPDPAARRPPILARPKAPECRGPP